MKRIVLPFVIVFTMMLVTACGSSAPAATQAPPVQPVVTEAPAQLVATEAPVATETPTPSESGTVVTITLADNTIQSSLTEFKTGVPYTFVISNTGRHQHTFDISTPVSIAGSLSAAKSSSLLDVTKSQLSPGASVTVNYTFPASAAGAPLEFSCLIQMHYSDGMKLAITVTN